MDSIKYLEYLVKNIHTTIVATVDDEGNPYTAAIDMMDYDENGIYFLTAKGKNFYNRLKNKGYIALTGIKGKNTMSIVSISIRGKVREIGPKLLQTLFEKNQYMNEIYPNKESREILTVFQIYKGTGEWFDLSKLPIDRVDFSFGGDMIVEEGYYITDKCTGCKECYTRCPQKCMDVTQIPFSIRQNNCIRCGNCYDVCDFYAIHRK